MKAHAIIEKTALFISKQGVQMEIMMKAKQKDNPQFQFLGYEDELNPYYQHLVKIMRSGRYVPAKTDDGNAAGQSQCIQHLDFFKNWFSQS